MKRPSARSLLTWSIVVAIAGFAVYKLKFEPTAVIAHTVVRGEIIPEVMATGTLEARVKTAVSARIQERLLEVLVDQGVTHDHRTLDVFDRILDVEDGMIRTRPEAEPAKS